MRFRKSIRLVPGVRMNLSGSGLSISLGPRGASLSVGKRGVHANVGIPGTGLYSRTKLSGGSSRAVSREEAATYHVKVSIDEETGKVSFLDEGGLPLSQSVERKIKQQHGDEIRGAMGEVAEKINADAIIARNIYRYTPAPEQGLQIRPQPYTKEKPEEPVRETLSGLIGFFARKKKQRIAMENAEKAANFEAAMSVWQREQYAFREAENQRITTIKKRILSDISIMDEYLAQRLKQIDWPHETLVRYEILSEGRKVALDIDLPEIEDLPSQEARVPQRGWHLSIATLSQKQQRLNYAHHIHSILFRIIGEVFSLLQSVEEVVASGYSQRPAISTGNLADEYLLSVRVQRSEWSKINFANLVVVDPAAALEAFRLNRSMSVTGIFKPIQPHSV